MGLLHKALPAIAWALVIWTATATPTKCRWPMDIAFLVDSSGSLGKRNYQILLDTVKSMATYLDVSPLGTHASVILFSDGVENPITFNDFLTLDRFKKKVSRLTYMSQRTRIDLALDMAAKKVFTKEGNVRDYVPKIAILMTDGRQTRTRDQLSLTEVAGNLRKKGVTLYVIGVGRGVARSELESLVEKRSYVIQQPDFRKLLQNIDNISQRVCEDHQALAKNRVRCEHPAELGFILHSSESLSRRHFNQLKQFISGIATAFEVDGAKSRAGLVLYSDKASVPIRLDQSKNLTEYIIALTNLRREAGRNRIDLALKAANQRLFTATSRDSASRVVVLLTLGKETKNGAGAISSKGIAGQMRARGIKIFVVAVGSNVDVPELQKIVDEPNRVIKAETFDDLDNEALVRRLCDESVPTARDLTAVSDSYSTISTKWKLPEDPENLITGYELTWRMIENDKEENIINAPQQSSGILPPETVSYEIQNLTPYTLYKIYLTPRWQSDVLGDTLETQSRTLEDINECLESPCDANADCTNTRRSFQCDCHVGYSGNGFTCIDDNECSENPCDTNSNCTNTPGSYKCNCNTGFFGDGLICIDNDECLESPCDAHAECTNTQGSFTCQCNAGYSGDGVFCNDVDECLNSPCDANAECTNTPGSFSCRCNTGYSGNGFVCTDNDECASSPCDVNARCTNTPGSFTCKCNSGYSGDGFNCVDDNECAENPCDVNAKCDNTPGGFTCTCNRGYSDDGLICTDVDECAHGPCDPNAKCTNTPGSFACQCNEGYSGNGFSCTDNNECGEMPCGENAQCTNLPGSFKCECYIGYSGDGFKCADINECESEVSKCDPNAKCFNAPGSYYCECNTGYNGNGLECSVVNICSYPMDLAFAVDTSASISADNFETQKAAVIMLARSFDLSKLGTHAAVIVYGTDASVDIKLGQYETIEEFSDAVRKLKYKGGETRIDKALAMATSQVFTPENGGRSGMPKMLIIMTDGQQTSAPDAVPLDKVVVPLRSSGVKIVTIAIGKEVDKYELIALSESRDNIHHVQSFETLFETVTDVGQSLCQKAKKDCKNHADIALLVDSSASMRGGNYLKEKSLVKAIAREFDVSMHGSHVGLVLYNNDAEVITAFNNKTTLKNFETKVDNLPLKGGKTRLDKALRLVASDVFTKEKGMRDANVPKIMFILTDGTQNRMCDEEALELAIAPLRNEGVHIVAIGVGEAEKRELRPLVKSPTDLLTGTDFDQVTEKVIQFIKRLCKDYDRSCSVGSQFVDISIGGCESEQPVEVGVCDGKCSSGTRYISEPPFYESRCTCCLPTIDTSKNIILKCEDGSTKLHRITEVSACECRSCGDSAAAPPVSSN